MSHLFVDSKIKIPVSFPAKTWEDHGLRFTWKEGGVKPMEIEPRLVVGHWTGGENGGKTVFEVLKSRKTKDGRGLSTQLFIDYKGICWQYSPLLTICRHASGVNPWSIGVEMQSRGVDLGKDTPKKWLERAPRGVFVDRLLGKERSFVYFTTEQMNTWVQLCVTLSKTLSIPAQIPGDMKVVDASSEDDDSGFVLRDTISKNEWGEIRGFIGHYHVHLNNLEDPPRGKLDPGPQPLEELWKEGFELFFPERAFPNR